MRVLTLVTKLLRGGATLLGAVAPVDSDPLSPMNAVGSILAKVNDARCVVGDALQLCQCVMEAEQGANEELGGCTKA